MPVAPVQHVGALARSVIGTQVEIHAHAVVVEGYRRIPVNIGHGRAPSRSQLCGCPSTSNGGGSGSGCVAAGQAGWPRPMTR